MDEFGTKLRSMRTANAMSQRALAQASGLTPSYVCKIESGSLQTPPSADAVTSLAKALGTDEVELLNAAGRVPSPFEVIGSQPEATRFFRRASEQIQDPRDWDRLTAMIDSPDFESETRNGKGDD